MINSETGFVDSLVAAVRENPLAAALIGGGAFWLVVGNDRLKTAASSAVAAASPLVDVSARSLRAAAPTLKRTAAPPTAPELDRDESNGVGEAVRTAGGTVSDAVSGASDTIKERFDEGVAYASENLGNLANSLPSRESVTKLQSSLADVLERQPLMLGVVGLAVGAAVAGAFQSSDLEAEWIGGLSDEVKIDLNRRAGAVTDSLQDASETLTAELGDTASEAVDRVKQAGKDAVNAARAK
jgi:hypothetical protein